MASKLPSVPNSVDLGLLMVRLWIGLIGFIHGSQKLFGLFGGGGIKGFAGYLQTLHVPAPTASAVMAGLAEFGGSFDSYLAYRKADAQGLARVHAPGQK